MHHAAAAASAIPGAWLLFICVAIPAGVSAAHSPPAPLPLPQLLQYGANIHHVNSKADGGSALHEAVAHKHEAVVELLLAHGGNPFVENIKVWLGGQE